MSFQSGKCLGVTSQWILQLKHVGADRVGCFLHYNTTGQNPSVAFANLQISMLNRKSNEFIPQSSDKKVDKFTRGVRSGDWAWRELSQLGNIGNLISGGFLTNEEEKLTLKFIVTIYAKAGCSVDFSTLEFPNDSGNKWVRKLTGDFSKLLETGDCSDVTLIVGGGGGDGGESGDDSVQIKAHKGILMARSPVFYSMFRNGMKESASDKVFIGDEDISAEAMKFLLKFIYSGGIGEKDWGAATTELMYAADKYGMQCLVEYLNENVSRILTIENVKEIRDVAKMRDNFPGVLAATIDFVRDNVEAFLDK